MSAHVATVNAFANKFGGFTGAIRNEATKVVTRERFATYDEARNWVKATAWEVCGPVRFAAMPRKGEYFANVWSA
jgi:hypothetical protein